MKMLPSENLPLTIPVYILDSRLVRGNCHHTVPTYHESQNQGSLSQDISQSHSEKFISVHASMTIR